MSDTEIFKNGYLSSPDRVPGDGRQDLNIKKITFKSWRQGRIYSELIKLI